MNKLIIASATALVFAAPLCASAETFTNGTSTNTGTTAITGCISSGSTDKTVTSGFNLSVQGSLQVVKSIAADGTVSFRPLSVDGSIAATKQVDGSVSISASTFTDTNKSWQSFHGTETSSTATAGSSAFNSISPQ